MANGCCRSTHTFRGWLSIATSSHRSPSLTTPDASTSATPCPISPELQEQPPKPKDSTNAFDTPPTGPSHEPYRQLSIVQKGAADSLCDKGSSTNQDEYVALNLEDAEMYRMISRKLLSEGTSPPGRMHRKRMRAAPKARSRDVGQYGSIDSVIMRDIVGAKEQ